MSTAPMNSSLKLALGLAGVLAAGFGSSVMAAEKAETKAPSTGIVCEDLNAGGCGKMSGCGLDDGTCYTPPKKGVPNENKGYRRGF